MGNSLPQPRDPESGQYISLERYIMSIVGEKFDGLRRELALDRKALDLQAAEYARRLEDLNHAHGRAQDALNTFVRIDKWEDKIESDEQAREIALRRLDERIDSVFNQLEGELNAYITKAEARQNDLDVAIAASEGAALAAQRAAENQGRLSDEQARELARKTNRNMAILGLVVAVVIAAANWLGA